jgi:hypothetical protein
LFRPSPETCPSALPIFGSVEARLQVQADRFRSGDFGDVTAFSATVLNRNGGVAIEDAAGSWQGGRISGRLAMSNGEGNGIFQTHLEVEDTDLSTVVWQRDGVPVASGRLDAVISAEATARSAADLMAALNGSGELRLSDLIVRGIDPAALPAMLAEADRLEGEIAEGDVRPIAERLVQRGEARLDAVTVPFTITGGEVRAQNVTAAAGKTKFSGQVRINLLGEALDGEVEVLYPPEEDGLAGGTPAVRFTYSGSLSQPNVEMSVAPLANFLSVRAFERERRRVEALQASVLEKQRLRREVALYRYLEAERQAARARAEAEEQARREEDARRQAEAAAQADRERAEAAAAAKAAEEERRRQQAQPTLRVPPSQEIFREELPVLQTPGIQNLPGVEP